MSTSALQAGVGAEGQRRPLLQSLLAAVCIVGIMLTLDLLLQTAIVTDAGRHHFHRLCHAQRRPAQPRRLLGGYLAGASAGLLCCWAARWAPVALPAVSPHVWQIIWAGAAVGLATYLMVRTHSEHPPAAGLALGLVLDEWSLATLAFVAGAVLLLSLLRLALKRLLADLV